MFTLYKDIKNKMSCYNMDNHVIPPEVWQIILEYLLYQERDFKIYIYLNKYFFDTCLKCLKHITYAQTKKIPRRTLLKMVNLESLNLSYNHTMKDKHLIHFTKLEQLSLECNDYINSESLLKLTNLMLLDLSGNDKILDEHLIKLTNLKSLNLTCNKVVTMKDVGHLTNITDLNFKIKR